MAQRPQILFPLFKPANSIKGVGPRIGKLIEKAIGRRILDVLWHLPNGLVDRRLMPKVAEAPTDTVVTLTLLVDSHQPPPNQRVPYKIRCSDSSDTIDLVFFRARKEYLRRKLPVGHKCVVSGKVEIYDGRRQITHPDHIAPIEQTNEIAVLEPSYGLTAGLTSNALRRIIKLAINEIPALEEWIEPVFLEQNSWLPWKQAVAAAHNPISTTAVCPNDAARERLAYDELLANQLALMLMRRHLRKKDGKPLTGTGTLRKKILNELPFSLTQAQERAITEILSDLEDPAPMLRLLQGDVGSGKTVVALLTMLVAIECGRQAALMAPTELLAQQHFTTLKPLAEAAGINIAMISGRIKDKQRKELLPSLSDGKVDLVIGTHSIFQSSISFKDLAVIVIDEQHRFGVHQRLAIASKGDDVNTLLMTATPIPRTLAMTAYGDIAVSKLDQKPPGRTSITTTVLPIERLLEVVAGLKREIDSGARAYWVCPLVEESEQSDLAAATQRHSKLRQHLGDNNVGLVHGQMKVEERDRAMLAFAAGDLNVLVGTTVIEVGIDVPEASLIVVEHAERFGLAQLHQLRGRVGRGQFKSNCVLLYDKLQSDTSRKRLEIIRDSNDGFQIAEEDLRLRGAGELLGTRQSGMPEFRVADVEYHEYLLEAAYDAAQSIEKIDPDLISPRGSALRVLLHLFEQESAVQYLKSG